MIDFNSLTDEEFELLCREQLPLMESNRDVVGEAIEKMEYDKDYWKPSFYTWTQETIDEINKQLKEQSN